MSDTVKLIIEIPKVYYEALSKTEEIISSQRSGKTLMSVIYSAVGNGTPLDSTGEYIKKSDLMDKVVMETLSDYTEHDVVHADDINSLQTYSFPERPKGEWLVTELFYEGKSNGAIIKCSKCGNDIKISPRRFENLYSCEKFCNNCGADMRGE